MDIFASGTPSSPGNFTMSPSRDLFGSWRSRPPQAFSMAEPAPKENGASPPLGSVFSTRKDTRPSPPPAPKPSPEAQKAAVAFDRGVDYLARRDHRRALDAWREAVSLDPSNRTFQANLKRLERLLASTAAEGRAP